MSYLVRGFLVCLALLALASPAFAWPRVLQPDAELVQQSELITVGHLKRGTVRPNTHTEGRGGTEHLAALVVTEALKRRCDSKEVTILLHHGLTPREDGRIFDTGSSLVNFEPIVRDAHENHLWFLRRSDGPSGRGAASRHLGVTEPNEVQSLSLRPYYAAHLAKDPAKAMKGLRGESGSVGKLAGCHLDLQDVGRARKLPDDAVRAERLLPYYAKTLSWWMHEGPERDQLHWLYFEARDALVGCGEEGGKQARKLFDDPRQARHRPDIIDLWGDARYRGGVGPLIALLQEHERFWAAQTPGKGWRHTSKSPLVERGWAIANETSHAVMALARIGGPQAAPAIRMTRTRWMTMDARGRGAIVEECDHALKEIGRAQPR